MTVLCEECELYGYEDDCAYCGGTGTVGCVNEAADKAEKIDNTWSDCNFTYEKFNQKFSRLKCGNCGGVLFQVFSYDWNTPVRCEGCGFYYIVHSG